MHCGPSNQRIRDFKLVQYADRGFVVLQVFSDRNTSKDNVPISPLLVVGAVHNHLVAARLRSRAALVLDSGEPREVHHFCTLLAFGADAVCPYLAYEALRAMQKAGQLQHELDFAEIEVCTTATTVTTTVRAAVPCCTAHERVYTCCMRSLHAQA